jgi:hypothetical protein
MIMEAIVRELHTGKKKMTLSQVNFQKLLLQAANLLASLTMQAIKPSLPGENPIAISLAGKNMESRIASAQRSALQKRRNLTSLYSLEKSLPDLIHNSGRFKEG